MDKKIVKKYRYSLILLRELVITEFKLRYQGSVLGYLWSVLRPLFLFVILYFVFIYFLQIGNDVPHWPVALLLGIVMWNFFSEITNNSVTSIVNRGDVIRKINFPKYVIVLAGSVSALINLAINLVVIGIFMIVNGVEFHWTGLLSIFPFIELFIFALGVSFLLSAIFVRVRDINYIWEVVMQGLFYASAIIYPLSMVVERKAELAQLILLNPIAQTVQDVRYLLISDANVTLVSLSGSWLWMLIPLTIVGVVFGAGVAVFKKRSPYFAEEV